MSKYTYDMVQRFIDEGLKTITIKWSEVEPAWKILIHERIIKAGYMIVHNTEVIRKYNQTDLEES